MPYLWSLGIIVLNAAHRLVRQSVPSRRVQMTDNTLTVIYVGAEDCAPCLTWRRDHRDDFKASRIFPKIDYRELIADSTKNALADSNWPKELRRYRDSSKRLFGAPAWLIVENHQVIASVGGLSNWEKNVWPFLKNNVR